MRIRSIFSVFKGLPLTLFCVSALLIAFELIAFQALYFTTSYLSAHTIISVALLGFSMGALFVSFTGAQVSEVFEKILATIPAIFLLMLIAVIISPRYPFLSSFFLLAPFFVGGAVASISFVVLPAGLAYAADFAGAALGVIGALAAMPLLREENSILAIAVLSAAAPLVFMGLRRTRKLVRYFLVYVLLIFAALFANLAFDYLNFARTTVCQPTGWREKVFCRGEDSLIMRSIGSVVERIDILDTGNTFLRTFFNGSENDHINLRQPEFYKNDPRLPGISEDTSKVLIIGTAAQGSVKAVKGNAPNSFITGVEINPQIVKLMRDDKEIYELSGGAYSYFDRLYVQDARSFLQKTAEKFDYITLLNTHRVNTIASVGPPDFLHTKEALSLYLAHLSANGMIVFEEQSPNERGEAAFWRLASTVLGALKDQGVERPANHVTVHTYWASNTWYNMLLVSRAEFSPADIAGLTAWGECTGTLRFSWRYLPYAPVETSFQRFINSGGNILPQRSKPLILGALSDDKPFPFDVYPDRKEVNGMFALVGIFGAALLAILFVVAKKRRNQSTGAGIPAIGFWVSAAYFFLIGLGFFFVEIVFLEWFQLYLGSPIVTLAVVLGGLLLFSGFGGYFLESRTQKFPGVVSMLFMVVLATIIFKLPWIFEHTLTLPAYAKFGAAIAIIGGIGAVMGIPFPRGINSLKEKRAGGNVPFLVGVNGIASALATPLALLSLLSFGFYATLLAGVGFYAAAYLAYMLVLSPRGCLKFARD